MYTAATAALVWFLPCNGLSTEHSIAILMLSIHHLNTEVPCLYRLGYLESNFTDNQLTVFPQVWAQRSAVEAKVNNKARVAVFNRKPAISLKWGKVAIDHQCMVSIGTEINDLGWPWMPLHSFKIHTFFGAHQYHTVSLWQQGFLVL